jgi:PAS domain S-box-containing protein
MTSVRPIIFKGQAAFIGASIDITESKKTEEALLISEERFRAIAENIPDLIARFDSDLHLLYANTAVTRLTGLAIESLLGKTALEYGSSPETSENWEKAAREVLNSGESRRIEQSNYWQGITKVFDALIVPEIDLDGKVSSVISIARDVTEMKNAVEALKQSEGKLRSVLDATQESIYMFDSEGHITMSNATGLRRLNNIKAEDLLGHHFSEFMPASTARARQEKLDEVIKTGKTIEFTDNREGRIYFHNFFPVFNDEKATSVVSYSTDITERKKSEDNLRASEERFRTIAESLPVLICIYNIKDSAFSFVNEHFEKTFGFYKSELITRKLPVSFFNPKDRKDLGNLLKEKGRAYKKEIRVKKKDGTPFWIMSSIRRILYMNEPSYLAASIDISDTKKAQEDLLHLNRVLDAQSKSNHSMMHSNNELNYIHDVCKIIIEDCGHTMVWVGYARNDKEKSVTPVAHYGFDKGYIDKLNVTWDDTERGQGPTGTAIRTGKPSMCKNMQTDPAFEPWREAAIKRGYSSSLVLPLLSDGKSFGAVSIYSKEPDPFSEPEIKLLTVLADDLAYGITYLRLAESEREAMRVVKESENKLKELIATKDKFFNIVAHDLKNPFTSLLGSSELLYDNLNQMTSENIRDLALILNNSAKGGYAILQNLLDWSRSQTGLLVFNPQDTNLKTIIDENIENLQLQTTTKGISLTSDLAESIIINSDRNMINTVLRNLLSNAVKYTHKNGKVVVGVLQSSKEIIVSVKDSGTGMTKEKVDSLFRLENSLSTPGTEKEQGTGLGLKLCKEFTERMGGRIWVVSKVGNGSDFKFTIPVKE